MFRTLRARRRNRLGAHLCAITAALLLLLSVSILHSRLLTSDHHHQRTSAHTDAVFFDDPFTLGDPLLLQDSSDPDLKTTSSDDRIDELDVVEDESKGSDEEEILRGVESEGEESEQLYRGSSSGYYFDHAIGAVRRALDRRSIDEIDRWNDFSAPFDLGFHFEEDRSKMAYGSDDIPVDEEVRRKLVEISDIEDALLLKSRSHTSPLREGWGAWFDAKTDFLRKDRMFKSNLEMLNPLNNPLLQDPDGVGITGLTRGDKLVQKGWLHHFKRVPFIGKKPLGFSQSKLLEHDVDDLVERSNKGDHMHSSRSTVSLGYNADVGQKFEIKRMERRTLDDNARNAFHSRETHADNDAFRDSMRKVVDHISIGIQGNVVRPSGNKLRQAGTLKEANSTVQSEHEVLGSMYGGGPRWGYFPGLHPHLSFSNFMDAFFRKGKCHVRAFMVWNSPSWMYSVRHQRGLESLLFHHPDTCVVIFSETIELDFFKEFLKDGYKIAVAMPNLEELLKDTPTSIFASVWHEWRTTKFYSTHYSELVRLAALYKYGGIYLDCDVVLLKPLTSFSNSVGSEDSRLASPLNGAVMAFRKHSSFVKDCLSEFYSSYDDTLLRWNGADLLTRVGGNFSRKANASFDHDELKVLPSSMFFPISSHDISRYFSAPISDTGRAHQNTLLRKILKESYTFHLWNSITSVLVPEPDSLVARVLNCHCIRCSDVL